MCSCIRGFCLFLKVNSEIELEGSIARFVETVVADVGKTDVVGEIGIEMIFAYRIVPPSYFLFSLKKLLETQADCCRADQKR